MYFFLLIQMNTHFKSKTYFYFITLFHNLMGYIEGAFLKKML
jgi:hypothetical protein